MYELILVTQSPRRRDLLNQAGYQFRRDSVKVSEIIDENLNPREAVQTLARQKMEAFVNGHKPLKGQAILALTADTMVWLEDQWLGKPVNLSQARSYLEQLSGKMHRVISALCFYNFQNQQWVQASDSTEIWFRQLSENEILNYLATGESMDKAGAYGIQGEAGKFVLRTEGSWTNVVGLPMETFERILAENGWDLPRRSSESSERKSQTGR